MCADAITGNGKRNHGPQHGGVTAWLMFCALAYAACSAAPPAVPTLSDGEFWRLTTEMSERPGQFEHAEHLVSNEPEFARVIQRLRGRGGAYVGVGPEQNFSYIAHLHPSIAFIVDIREDVRNVHLLYKALFEMTADRGEFVSRLFSRGRPAGITASTPVADLFTAFERVLPSTTLYDDTLRLVRDRLIERHAFALTPEDLHTVETTLRAFYTKGPEIQYGRSLPPADTHPTYRTLMTTRDLAGRARSFLASEEAFATVKDLQSRNRVIPVVGDFAGPHALRSIGTYLRENGHAVTAFYASNVEVYLNRDQTRTYCQSLATLPTSPETSYIRSKNAQLFEIRLGECKHVRPSLHWP